MISSMTGYGRGEAHSRKLSAAAEVRSVNNRFLEVSARLPRSIALRENDVKEMVRTKFVRGKVSVAVSFSQEADEDVPVRVNESAVRAYHRQLLAVKKITGSKERITLGHILNFPEIFTVDDTERGDEKQWAVAREALAKALDEAALMRSREGQELMRDLLQRIQHIDETITTIENIAKERVPQARHDLEQRVHELVGDRAVIDQKRLEMEIALLADKLDTTEECVRFRSHNKFFVDALANSEASGRKLNFLLQEMNREANTIGSKSNSVDIAHLVVRVKEELEKIREQLQNIE
jgi:uncharacterized protein (TIGR00255 family)